MADNTLLIDDSPEKGICNERRNNVIVPMWTHMKQKDDYLMEELLPWLKHLISDYQPGRLREYVEANCIGLHSLVPSDYDHTQIVGAMRDSARDMGVRFELPANNLVIGRGRQRT